MSALWAQFRDVLDSLWRGLRQWSGDSAYETYLACANREQGREPMSPAEFYVEQLNRKYTRPNRCC
jgi:uncharacterized short protein YbdD (DUF466 family)